VNVSYEVNVVLCERVSATVQACPQLAVALAVDSMQLHSVG
jgi:hypothetical protein